MQTGGAPVVWAPNAVTGTLIPLDPRPVPGPPEARLVALSPAGSCRVLTGEDAQHPGQLSLDGDTLHRSHFASCPDAARWRRR